MFDYVSAYWFLLFFLVTPLFRTRTELDLITIPIWLYCTASLYLPFHIIERHLSVQDAFALKTEQKAIMILVAVLVMLVKTESWFFEEGKIEVFLGVLGLLNLGIFFIMYPIAHCNIPTPGWFPLVNFLSHAKVYAWPGVTWNASMAGMLNVILFPYMLVVLAKIKNKEKSPPIVLQTVLVVLIIIAAFMNGASSPVLSLCGAIIGGAYLIGWFNLKDTVSKPIGFFIFISPFILIIAVLVCVAILLNPSFLDNNGRFEGYRFFFSQFSLVDWLVGRGPGSFIVYSIKEQLSTGFRMGDGLWLWIHSDPLQVLYEYGVLGVGLVVAFLVLLIKRIAWNDAEVFAVFAFLFGGLFYYPVHYPLHLLVLFLVLRLIYKKSERVEDILQCSI